MVSSSAVRHVCIMRRGTVLALHVLVPGARLRTWTTVEV